MPPNDFNTMQLDQPATPSWMELGEAAEFLGVHFTTLRRWADAGEVPCIRTPGGRRRFQRSELVAFVESLRQGKSNVRAMISTTAGRLQAEPLQNVGVRNEPWYERLDESQRSAMRSEGQQLMAILMQYASRNNGGDVFLEEGKRLAIHYGKACRNADLSLVETAQAFVRVRRSIMDSVYEAGALAGSPDAETWRLYDRMNHFLDSMLLATLEAYTQAGAGLLRD